MMKESEFREFFLMYAEDIRNYLYFLSGDENLAKDLTQDVFIKFWEKRGQIKMASAKGLLYTMAKNLFLDYRKHQQVKFKFWRTLSPNQTTEDPSFQVEQDEFREQLIKTIQSLPEEVRSIFLMNRIEKLKYREIAERLDISIKTVEKKMSAALKVLRALHPKI